MGCSPGDLYGLAEKSTVESFGPIPYSVKYISCIVRPLHLRVELFDFISDTGILDGLDVGTIYGKHLFVKL